MATQQEVLEIVTELMLNAPPGEFLDVVHDIRGLLADESILNSIALPIFREYNTDHMTQIAISPDQERKMLITKDGELSENEYIDHRSRQVVQFDHFHQRVVSCRPLRPNESNSEAESLRAALEDAMCEYVEQHFPQGTSTVYCPPKGEADQPDRFIICTSVGAFQPHNYWNGRWRSRWEFTHHASPSSSSISLHGTIRLHVHYYEEGNVQMRSEQELHTTAALLQQDDHREFAAVVVKAITKAEADYQQQINRSYDTMGDTTFKALRRVLPITRSKIDWDKLQNYTLASGISASEFTMD